MKPTLSYIVLLLFITTTTPFIFSTGTGTGTASAAQDFVKDSTGKKVLNDVPYHVGPVKGGRIKLTNTTKICPFDVVQQDTASEVNPGGQFMFTLIGTREKYLRKSSILGIDSGYPKSGPCQESTFWTIPDAESTKAPDNLITTGGSFETDLTCFQVVEYPKPTNPKVPSYLLQHCPSFCGAGPNKCFNVSIYVHKGVRRLASTGGTPFELVFYKV